jgi:hypothetical protein
MCGAVFTASAAVAPTIAAWLDDAHHHLRNAAKDLAMGNGARMPARRVDRGGLTRLATLMPSGLPPAMSRRSTRPR